MNRNEKIADGRFPDIVHPRFLQCPHLIPYFTYEKKNAKITSPSRVLTVSKLFYSIEEFSIPLRNFLFHGGIFYSMEEFSIPWRNFLFHGGIFYSMEEFSIPLRNFLFHGGIFYSMEEFSIPLRNFLFHWGIFYSMEEFSIPLRNFLFHWGIFYSMEEFSIPLRNFLFHWGIFYSIEEFSIPLRNFLFHWGIFYSIVSTAWCIEFGSLASLDAPEFHASSDVREPISLHQDERVQWALWLSPRRGQGAWAITASRASSLRGESLWWW